MNRSYLLGFVVLLAACASDDPKDKPSSGEFDVLNYNVAAFPPGVKEADPGIRIEQIAPLLTPFHIAGLQEVWHTEYYDVLADGSGAATQVRFDEPLAGRLYGSGLAVFSSFELVDFDHVNFELCEGFIDSASDCLASKGFQMIRLKLANGAELDFYNTHLEAGKGDLDLAARDDHVDHLLASINGQSADRAIILVGDLNLHDDEPAQNIQLERLIGESNFRDSCDEIDCEEPGHIERLFMRDGGGVTLSSLSWNSDDDFFDSDGLGLSDHPAIRARFSWQTKP